MDIQFGDIQETALVTLAIRASESARENPRIVDEKAKEIIDTLGVDVSKFDLFLSHEGVVACTIMFAEALRALIDQYPDALCINLGCGFHIVEFFNSHHPDPNDPDSDRALMDDQFPDGMFRFEKKMG